MAWSWLLLPFTLFLALGLESVLEKMTLRSVKSGVRFLPIQILLGVKIIGIK